MAGGGGRLAYIEQVVVVRNEHSTHSQRAEQLIARLRESLPGKRVSVIAVGEDDPADNRRTLLHELHRAPAGRSLLVVAGGDGTAHLVAETLLDPDTPQAYRITPITAWPLGNGNDFFHSTHAAATAHDPLLALFSPSLRSVRVHPLEWHIRAEKGDRREISLCYGTVGVTASATDILNEPTHRARRRAFIGLGSILFDVFEGSRTMWFPKQFSVRQGKNTYRAIELQFNNGPRMVMQARYPERLSDTCMFFSKTGRNDPLSVGVTALRMSFGHVPGVHCAKPLSFRLNSDRPIHAQTDGEPFVLPNDVSFTIGPGEASLVVWASKTA